MERRNAAEETLMDCVICKLGRVAAGFVTVSLQRGEATVVIKRVPADVCDNCGEYYLGTEAARGVLELAESASGKGIEVEIPRYAA